jgi:hypothetical protein
MLLPMIAYLDPTSGSIAWQVAISSILAAAAACRLYWQKVKRLFHLEKDEDGAKDASEPGRGASNKIASTSPKFPSER